MFTLYVIFCVLLALNGLFNGYMSVLMSRIPRNIIVNKCSWVIKFAVYSFANFFLSALVFYLSLYWLVWILIIIAMYFLTYFIF